MKWLMTVFLSRSELDILDREVRSGRAHSRRGALKSAVALLDHQAIGQAAQVAATAPPHHLDPAALVPDDRGR
jgi:hypothetical protein